MGHLVGKDIYRALHSKIDAQVTRAPWSETFHEILKELYSPEDAELIIKMPYGIATVDRIAQLTGRTRDELRRHLDSLCTRGLVIDLFVEGEYRYMVSPLVIGIFEFTMMRTDDGFDAKRLAHLFHDYMDSGLLYSGNYGAGEKTGLMRAMPHPQAFRDEDFVEVMDYERAADVVEQYEQFSIGLCSCRHKERHAGEHECEIPLRSCTTFGKGAEFLIRRGLAEPMSKTEMLEHLDRSRELGLVICADNVQQNVGYFCHCCGCCCGVLQGLSKHGYPHLVTTSNYLPRSSVELCKGCNHCEKACPIDAITMAPDPNPSTKRKKKPVIDDVACIGCGVCALKCKTGAMHLEPRGQRVIHPENTFERVLISAVERGRLQNMLFDDPNSATQKYMRAFVGGFLRLEPVKKALLSDQLRSRFLKFMETGVKLQGKGWVTKM